MKSVKYFRYILLLPILLLTSCNKGSGPLIICPIGAPSLAFYDQGDNANFNTISDAKQIVAQFQNNKYDAIVIDATNGLEQIRLHPKTPYRFARLLTSGNLYLISYKNTIAPSENNEILSFGNRNSVPYLVSEKLNATWKAKIDYKDSVKDVLTQAMANPLYKDYFLLAEPMLTTLKQNKGNPTYIKSYKDLLNNEIPQAALFINKEKKAIFKEYFINLNQRIDNSINHLNIVKEALDKYISKDDIKLMTRFGFPNIDSVISIQNNNGFAMYLNDDYNASKINDFLDKINYDESIRYDESYFVKVND